MLITHDLGVVAQVADEIAVMYAGRIVEQATARRSSRAPEHPYTWGLLRSIPRLDLPRDEELVPIPGPPAVADPRARRAARSTPAVRTCEESHKRDRPAARAGRRRSEAHAVACLLPSAERRAIWSALQQNERDALRARRQAPAAEPALTDVALAGEPPPDEPPLTAAGSEAEPA